MQRPRANHIRRRLAQSVDGAVAPIIALSLFALVAAGGVAFDYSRLASMDSELQGAADQAALAAATQLDGETGAIDRATAAGQSLITNSTRFANDTLASAIDVPTITFYVDKAKTTVATGDSDANFVEVEVETRRANFAFTPIVGAFFGELSARAFAGVDSALCGVVPFFVCNPVEPVGNIDLDFAVGGIPPGAGIVMAEGGAQWGPGNFGFLDQAGTGADGVAEALASDALLGNCSGTQQITTKPGNILNAVRDSLNMRFDFDPGNSAACKNPPCSPSTNVRKDVVRASSCSWVENTATAASLLTNSPGRYRPTSAAALASSVTPAIMGFPRDLCHAFSATTFSCTYGRVGNGDWDRGAYFRSNHPGLDWANTAGIDADGNGSITRYETYLWEADDPTTRLTTKVSPTNSSLSAYSTPQAGKCLAPGVAPNPAGIDRRRITAAVVNCRRANALNLLNGKKTIPVAGFIDMFLVEPSIDRTKCSSGSGCNTAFSSRNDIYVEAISAAGLGEGGAVGQITRRDVPRLIE